MISSPIFRHKDDEEYYDLNELHRNVARILVKDDSEEAMIECISRYQASDNTLLDIQKLLLLGVLYCKGSRIGKSNLLYPLIVHDVKLVHTSASPLDQRETAKRDSVMA